MVILSQNDCVKMCALLENSAVTIFTWYRGLGQCQ